MLTNRVICRICSVAAALGIAFAAQAQPVVGACCTPSGFCVETTREACDLHGGTYQGDNTRCTDADCPRPATGACCLRGFCFVLPQALCESAGGTYQGDNVACAAVDCSVPCECDWNDDGVIDANDFFAFLRDFFDGNADFNGDGATNTRDFFDFLFCFLRC
jgi:hypothetical protein